jgi:hypothetical protein
MRRNGEQDTLTVLYGFNEGGGCRQALREGDAVQEDRIFMRGINVLNDVIFIGPEANCLSLFVQVIA